MSVDNTQAADGPPLDARTGSARYRVEDRISPVSMGIQRRIVGPRFSGPWVQGTTGRAWKAYKAARRSPNAVVSDRPERTAQDDH